MASPSICLASYPASEKKALNERVTEVMETDGVSKAEAYVTAAHLLLHEAKAEHAGIVAQINAAAQRNGHTVNWGEFAPKNTNFETPANSDTLEGGTQRGDNGHGQNDAGNDGAGTLGAVASAENGRTEGSGGIQRGDADGREQGVLADVGSDSGGIPGARSGGSGLEGSHSAAGRGTEPGRLGGTGESRSGTKVSADDVRSERPAERNRSDLTPVPTPSNAPSIPATNFRITDDLRLGKGGEVEKFNDNLQAIRTLKQIEDENRRATPTEQSILARYVGWGGLANAFPDPFTGEYKDAWKSRGPELASLLSPTELAQASRSTLDSHYTSQTVVNAMWDAARQLGFKGGLTLESSMGTGNFLGLIPNDLAKNTKFVGVEYDGLTSRIAQALYPQETVLNSGFQNVPLADGTFDLSIGNPPFGNQSLRFQFKPELNRLSIHNQFFLASLDAVKPGGLQVQVVSRYLMDAADATARNMLASKAKLLAAIRLPDTAFKENARTEVVTDILFLQRLTAAEEAGMSAAFEAARSKQGKNYQAEAERRALADQVPTWVNTTTVPDPLGGDKIKLNNYFAQNPHMIMGSLERSGSMAHGKDVTVRLDKSADLAGMLKSAIDTLPTGVMVQQQSAIDASIARHKEMSDSLHIALEGHEQGAIALDKDGSMQQVIERETPEGDYELMKRALSPASPWAPDLFMNAEGKWYKVEPVLDAEGKNVKVMNGNKPTNRNLYERKVFDKESDIPAGALLGETRFNRLKQLVAIRDSLKAQLNLEAEDAPAKTIEANRKTLNAAYKQFVKENGFISESANSSLVQNMPDGALVQALEHGYRPAISKIKADKMGEKARDASSTPAPILSERVINKYIPPTEAATHADAMLISMAESGRVDMDRIASLMGKSRDEVAAAMLNADKPLVFTDPETGNIVSRDEYLSGQVVRKLEAARNANLPQNVRALTEVQPEAWGAENVTPILGAAWIPTKHYKDFIDHITGGDSRVQFSALTNAYTIDASKALRANEEEWGTSRRTSASLIDDLLNSRSTKVLDYDTEGKAHINQEETALAALKARAISAEFNDWVFKDGDRRNELVSNFNDKFNTVVNRQHDGSHLILPGKVPDAVIEMRRHQKNAIWRGIAERFMLLDHAVGAGKTFTTIARVMERRRMGLSKKPMIVVPNHMVNQYTADAYRLYPGAKVLAASKGDFEKSKRRKLFAKIATGDHDMVIVPHSSFFFIPISQETEQRYLAGELQQAEAAIKDAAEAAEESGQTGFRKPFGVKEAERLRDKITARMDMLKGQDRKDRLLSFEQMGIDDLTVDEADEFKNLFYSSRLTGVKGMGNKTGSQKAFDLYNKVRVLTESPTGSVVFATGTPISNSAVEMYTMKRYLAAAKLKELGLDHFDAWRAQYVSTDAGWEPNETGRLKEVNRLGRTWSNMRSLMDLYRSFTDSVSNDDIKKAYAEDNGGAEFPLPKVIDGGRESVVIQPTKAQVGLLNEIIEGFDGLPGIKDPMERNIARLKLMDRARKVSLDVRAVDPSNPSDEKGGKLDVIAQQVKALYDKWHSDRGTQLIFLDRSVPKAKEDATILKNYDALLAQQSKALANGDDEALRRVGESLEPYDANAMEEIRLAQNGGWNAYQQIKDNLVKLGIPAGEIRFVQEANNDAQKQALFDSVKDGSTRVLLGSTMRMGAGTNVQDRLVGLHHADVTWKPRDIEQREGRIIRQGNKLLDKYGMDDFAVAIKAYATERTIDAKMWNLNSSKLKMINGIRKYDGAFTMDFEDNDSVSMAELAALASGDPLLLERVKLMSDIDNLELLKRQHARKEWGIISLIEDAQRSINKLPGRINDARADLDLLQNAFSDQSDKVATRSIDVEGLTHYTATEAKKAAYEAQQRQQAGDDNAKFSVSVNGKRKASQNGYIDEISNVFGDNADFEMDMGGNKFIGRTDAARYMSEQAAKKSIDLKTNEEASQDLGTYLGMPLEAIYTKNWNDNYIATLALLRPDGSTLATGQTRALEAYSTAGMRAALSSLDDDLDVSLRRNKVASMERDLASAKAGLPALEARRGSEFSKQAELDDKNSRLEQVIQELAKDKTARAIEGDPDNGEIPLPSNSTEHAADDQNIPLTSDQPAGKQGGINFSRGTAGTRAQAGGITDGQVPAISKAEADKVVKTVVGGLKNGLAGTSIKVVDSFNDLPKRIIDAAIREKAENAIYGVNSDNTIYLVRDKHMSPEQLEKTLLHELYGHEGLAKLFGEHLEARMNDLFHAIGGMDGMKEIAARHKIDLSEYVTALGNDETKSDHARIGVMMGELLSHIAEDKPTLKTKIQAFLGMLRSWLRAHGFTGISRGTDADLYHLLAQSRDALDAGGVPRAAGTSFARTGSDDHLQSISQIGDAFRYGKSDGKTMEDIVHDVNMDLPSGNIAVRKITSIPGETRYQFTFPDGSTARMMDRPFNKLGSLYGFDMADGEMVDRADGRPGKNGEAMHGKDDVYIDASLMNPGSGFGSLLYHIAATYAHNTGKVFIGDPAGMTDEALRRRPEQMLSSALKYGTTEHLAPHPIQVSGKPDAGVAPLKWVYGDHVGNVQKLIDVNLRNLDNQGGNGGVKYDAPTGRFTDADGKSLTRDDIRGLASSGLGREAQAGGTSLARHALLKSILEGQSGFHGDPRESNAVLGTLSQQLRNHVSTVGTGTGELAGIFYKRTLGDTLAQAGNSIKEVRLPADYMVGDLFNGAGKINWWHKTIGTQFNLAERNPLFRTVYNRVQNFIGDVSLYANEAANLAPTIIPKLEQTSDIWKKSPISAIDTKAIAAPIFEGTLSWNRGVDGKPLKLADMEKAAESLTTEQKAQVLLRKGVIHDEQNKRWMGSRLADYDDIINSRFEQSELQGGIVWSPDELRSIFKLDNKQIALYQEFRQATDRSITNLAISDMVKFGGDDARGMFDKAMATGSVEKAGELLRDHFMELAKEEPERANAHIDTATQMIDKADRAQRLIDKGYAPLSRYGNYTVYVTQGGEEKYFGMFEDRAEASKMARQMRANYPDAEITHGTMSNESYKLFQGVSPETVELFGAMLGLDKKDTAGNEAYQAYLKLAKNNRSAMKRLIMRKGIAGFSEDSARVLAGFLYSNAKLTSMNAHMGELNNAIEAIPKTQGELKDAAVKLADHVKNPQGGGSALGGLMFSQYLGGSVASAMVNLTQPFAMTFPYLSQYGGVTKSASRMLSAVRDAGKAHTGDAKLDAALKWATGEGIVAPQEVHQLKAQAAGNGVLKSGDGTRAGDTKAAISNVMSKISLGWGKLFSMAELTNRRVTFIAAYRTAIEEGIANPEKFAANAIAATQGVYNAGNKPTWGRSTVGGLAMTFKQYSIAYIELLSRMATAGEPGSEERKAGQRGALTMLAVMMLMGGANGLPFEQDIEDVIDGILQRMGYNFSAKRAKQEFLINTLGQDGADIAQRGLSGMPGVPIDIAGRFSMGKLVPGTGLLTKKDSHASDVGELFGPTADVATRFFGAANKLVDGKVLDAASDMLPQSLRNIEKGADMLNTGTYRDQRGYKINDTTPTEAVMKMVGFQPNSTAHIQDAKGQVLDLVGQTRMESKEIQEKWAQGIAASDKDMINEARQERDDWNAKNPDTPIIISMPSIAKRVREMRMSTIDRVQKTAPKALKMAVHRQLSEV